jgi:hypothetical protein
MGNVPLMSPQPCWLLESAPAYSRSHSQPRPVSHRISVPFPSSGFVNTSKQKVSETLSVCVLGWRGEEALTLLGLLEWANLNHWAAHVQFQVQVILRPTVSRPSVLVPGYRLGPATNFSFSLWKLSTDICGFLVWGALSDEITGL